MSRQTLLARGRRRAVMVVSAAAVIGVSASIRADEPSQYEKLVADHARAFVTLKFVLKSQGRFGSRESESEATGIMVASEGLVLCSNAAIGGRRFGSATPTHIKVLIGDDTDGLDAELLARDSELDLAWVRVKDPGEKTFVSLDLSKAETPKRGQRLLAMRKMSRYFDRAILVSEGRLAGKTSKPRNLLVPGGGLDLVPGLPVFTEDGSVVGVVVRQMPDKDAMAGNMAAFLGAGRDMARGLILPTVDVVKATRRAKEVAEEEDAEEEEEEEEDDDEEGKGDDPEHDRTTPKVG